MVKVKMAPQGVWAHMQVFIRGLLCLIIDIVSVSSLSSLGGGLGRMVNRED